MPGMWLVTANCQELEIFAVRVRGFGGGANHLHRLAGRFMRMLQHTKHTRRRWMTKQEGLESVPQAKKIKNRHTTRDTRTPLRS
jgi:hypothetical protein